MTKNAKHATNYLVHNKGDRAMTTNLRRAMLDSRVPQEVKAHIRAQKEAQTTEPATYEQVQKPKKEHVNGKRKKPNSHVHAPQYGYR